MENSYHQGALDKSPWRFIGFGIVTENNLAGNDNINVWMAELLPFEEGQVSNNQTSETQLLVDINGSPRRVSVDRSSKIEARWYCTTDGRQTAPNVTDGETVEIYQYAQESPLRWVSNGRQPELRRLEHVTVAYSNLSGGRSPFAQDSSYGHTWSTREKFVRLWTSKSDGEKYAYQFYFDTKSSRAAIHDDVGNALGFNSQSNEAFMRSSLGAYVRIVGNDVHIKGGKIILDGETGVNDLKATTVEAKTVTAVVINREKPSSVTLPEFPFVPNFNIGSKQTGTSSARGSVAKAVRGFASKLLSAWNPDKRSVDDLERRVMELELIVKGYHESEPR